MHRLGSSRGFTSEIKFIVDAATGERIREWARQRLVADPNGGGPRGDEYRVSSLYFDTDDRAVYQRRGSYGRSKYRIRRYGQDNSVFLERKLRTGNRLAKWRTSVDLAALAQLTGHNESSATTDWFRRRIAIRQLRPVCQVSYMRTARAGDTADGPARMTIDHEITAIATSDFSFERTPFVPLLEAEMIVELKYRGTIPAVFRQLVEDFALQPGRSSKYRVAAGALGLVPLPLDGAPMTLHA
jgi:SPX domain protein involved in polyphosphate accumulation